MGRMLGSFADEEELERPDLNKCPDCSCFFGGLNCPICGKVCPEEMRAGNRKPVKKKKTRRQSGSGRVTFVSWYHSWWFIVLMMIFFPLVGIVLLITSPHERWKKIVFVAVAVAYMIFSSIGIGNVINFAFGLLDRPVTTNLTKEEYIDRVIAFLSHLSPEVVVERLFSRVPEEDADFSNWNTSWWKLLDELLEKMQEQHAYQGKDCNYLNGRALNKL